jgi:ATP-dependent DNA helicase PIF1
MDITTIDHSGLKEHMKTMKALKRKRRPNFDCAEGNISRKGIKDKIRLPETSIVDIRSKMFGQNQGMHGPVDLPQVVDDIIDSMQLRDNEEQLRAFRIVAEQIKYGGPQLLMYIAGVGGTGKSHMIHAIVRLFEELDRRAELMLSAPTGIAAVLIGGYTIHALTMLPDKTRSDFTELRSLWANKRWLIVDEVSMISAKFLSQISDRLRQAKGEDQVASHLPFGGLNVIFTGDFGQLKPVRQSALYAHTLTKRPTFAECQDGDGVSSLNGAFLWRQVNVVVKLTKNVRQKDDSWYADFLSRLRLGQCYAGSRSEETDLEILRKRELSKLCQNQNPESIMQFHDVPVIVGNCRVRDALNATLVDYHARRLNQKVFLYHSKDYIRKEEVKGTYQEKLWKVSSSQTEDALGRIPIFCGMKVMVTTNLAISRGIVNGAEGVVQDILYTTDHEGRRYASVAYVRVARSGSFAPDLDNDVVPVLPERTTFEVKIMTNAGLQKRTVTRLQLPLVPAYSYTDYKSQGRSLDKAIVDLASARSLQGVYVMLSRVKSIEGLGILRWFPTIKVYQRLSEELRDELKRVDHISTISEEVYTRAMLSENYPAAMLSLAADCAQATVGS